MKLRYEIKDTFYPNYRGQRFTSEERARKELAHAVGTARRFELRDRATNEVIGVSK